MHELYKALFEPELAIADTPILELDSSASVKFNLHDGVTDRCKHIDSKYL